MRRDGVSLNDIAHTLRVSKGSVSEWVRDIPLSFKAKEFLAQKSLSSASIEKRRASRLANEFAKRKVITDLATREIKKISDKELKYIGIALYWGEGGKTRRGSARVSNADPAVIQVMMAFFRRVCFVPEEKFRGYIHIHSHLQKEAAEKYWSDVSGIPRAQFFKTYSIPSKAGSGKRDTLPYGTFDIYVNDTKLFLTIMGWIKGLERSILGLTLLKKP